MSLVETMQQMLPEFSKNERKVAEHFIAHPYEAQRLGVDSAADVCDVSRSSIIRFCHKLGFKGYSEFRYTLMSQGEMPTTVESTQDGVAERYLECFEKIRTSLTPEQLSRVGDLIYRSNRVICLGQWHSGVSAQQLAFRLNRIGIDAQAIVDITIASAYIKLLSPSDTVVVFSISGKNSYPELLEEYRKARARIVLVTMSPKAASARYADEVLVLPSALTASRGHILDEAPAFFFTIELIIEAVSHKMAPIREDEG